MSDAIGHKVSFSRYEIIGSLIVFVTLTIAITWPQLIIASRSGYSPDYMLHLWALEWDLHALTTNPLGLFNTNIFYPARNTLALSDHLLGLLPLWLLFYLPSGDAHASFNWTALAMYALTGWGTYLLARYWTGSKWGALAAGIIAGFHPIKMYHYGMLPVLSYAWFPLILLCIKLHRDTGRKKWLAWVAALYALQLMSGLDIAVPVSLGLGAYLTVSWVWNRDWRTPRFIVMPLMALIIGMAMNIPLLMPYFYQEKTMAMSTPAEGHEALLPKLPQDLFKISSYNRLYGLLLGMGDSTNPQPLFPGVVFPLLLVAGLAILIAKRKSGGGYSEARWTFGIPALFLAAISVGAHPIIFGKRMGFPLPFTVLAWIIPGFHNIRVPQRAIYIALVYSAIFVAYAVSRFTDNGSAGWKKALVGAGCAAALMAECWMAPLRLNHKPDFVDIPPIYAWLRNAPLEGGVLELPYDSQGHFLGATYDLMSLTHLKPTVNGYNGYVPTTVRQLVKVARKLPDMNALRIFDIAGVHTIIEHGNFDSWLRTPYPEPLFKPPFITSERPMAEAEGNGLKLITRIGADTVWEIDLPPIAIVSTGSLMARKIFRGPNGEAVITIDVVGDGDRMWVNPRPVDAVDAQMIWRPLEGGPAFEDRTRIPLPIASIASLGETDIFANFPKTEGEYELEIRVSDNRVRGAVTRVTIMGRNER